MLRVYFIKSGRHHENEVQKGVGGGEMGQEKEKEEEEQEEKKRKMKTIFQQFDCMQII